MQASQRVGFRLEKKKKTANIRKHKGQKKLYEERVVELKVSASVRSPYGLKQKRGKRSGEITIPGLTHFIVNNHEDFQFYVKEKEKDH